MKISCLSRKLHVASSVPMPTSLSFIVERRRDAASPRAQLRNRRRRRRLHLEVAGALRRQLGLGVVQEEIAGDLVNAGYFSAQLLVGTPPQPFSLIVDTGSSVTAIPCTGCRECGVHSNPRFEPARSQTFERLGCDASAGYYCASCDAASECGYRVAYQEGSSYSGYLALDTIRVGQGGACVQLEFPFGCSTEETGLFTSQQADGIMGLGTSRRHAEQSNPTVLEALVERRLVEDVFSLCIGALRGTLTFGMPQLATARSAGEHAAEGEPPSLFWTRVVESTYYGVEVTAIMLGEQALGPASLPSSSIVDSGTTFMYLHSAAFSPLLATMRAKRCPGLARVSAPKDEFCVRVSDSRLRLGRSETLRGSNAGALFDGCFDEVRVQLEGGSIRMAPSRYFYASEDADEFCLGIFDNYEDSLVIGAINMMDHEVIFDRVGRRIGFYPRECSISSSSASSSASSALAAAAAAASASALGLANLSASAVLGPDPCGDHAAPPPLLRLRLAAAHALHARSPLVDLSLTLT